MLVAANGVELWTESYGDDSAETVLLISGADSPCTRWDMALVKGLMAEGCRVVRFDNRDCGLSTKVDPDHLYLLDDMARDTVALLDALEIETAHVIGRSMGGMIAQLLALDNPSRVGSLGLLITSPGLGDERLPGPKDDFVEKMAARHLAPPPKTRDDRVEYLVELFRLFAGTALPFDETAIRRACADEVDRCWYPESGHGHAAWSVPSRLDRLGEISVPTLIMHGTADPVIPIEHAYAMAERIPHARTWMVEGLGHETPAALTGALLREILAVMLGQEPRGRSLAY